MFLAHFGLAFATKRVAPASSLGTTVMAAQWADGISPVLLLLGIERAAIRPGIAAVTPLDFVAYPLSHSLLADIGWAVLRHAGSDLRDGHVRSAGTGRTRGRALGSGRRAVRRVGLPDRPPPRAGDAAGRRPPAGVRNPMTVCVERG